MRGLRLPPQLPPPRPLAEARPLAAAGCQRARTIAAPAGGEQAPAPALAVPLRPRGQRRHRHDDRVLQRGAAWGVAGAAAAYDISSWLTALAQVAYVVGWCRDGWTGLSRAAFNELWAFVKLSLASAVMLCLEIWYMMVLVVLTGHLDDAEIAVDSISICMNINGWEGMLFIGLSAAISVRVSNELGSGRPRAAKHAVMVVVGESLLIGLLCMALFFFFF